MGDASTTARATRSTLPDGTVVLRSERFTLAVKRLAPGKILLTAIGYEDGGTFDLLQAELEKEIARTGPPGVTIYCDLTDETGIAPESRERWGKWSKSHGEGAVAATHILVRSRLVDMAISLIGLFVGGGGMQSYADAAKLEAVIKRDVPGFRGLPRYPELVAERATRAR